MVIILMISAKMAILGLLEIKIILKCYDVITYIYEVTNKILVHDSNHFVDVVMWIKFGNSSISMRELIITSMLQIFNLEKKNFFEG